MLQGHKDYSNEVVAPGDTLVSVAAAPVQGFNGDDLGTFQRWIALRYTA